MLIRIGLSNFKNEMEKKYEAVLLWDCDVPGDMVSNGAELYEIQNKRQQSQKEF
ncbi:hypothetical protein BH11BAC5_BH11BAC5_45120 [soil metagenome]